MKKFAFFAALAAVAVVGCNKQEKDLPVDAGRTIVVKVTAENDLTRGDYNEAGSFIWSASDRIGVNMYAEAGHDYNPWSAPLVLTAGEGTPDGTFTYDGSLPNYVHYGTAAFYPYDGTNQPASNVGGDGNMYFYLPASIDYVEGMNRMMLVGAIEQDATDIHLYQAGAGIRISLKDVPARATKVSLTVGDMSIAGIWPSIAPGDAGTAAASAPTGGESTVTYNIATASDVRDMVFTYAVPVQDYAGARLTVTVAEGNNTIWTKSGTVNTSPGRGQILAMPELTVKDPANTFYLSYRDGGGNNYHKVLKFADGSGTAQDPFTVTGSVPEVAYAYIERGDGVTYYFPSYVDGNTGVAYIEYGGSHPNEVMKIDPDVFNSYSLVINDYNSVTLSYSKVFWEENLAGNYFIYDGRQYNVVYMQDNRWWMAQNLAYLPEGVTPATELTAVTAGVFAPIQVNAAHSAAEFTTDPVVVAANGYLYQAEFALGLQVGDLTSVADAQKLEGAQGICPRGWHIPTLQDIMALVGKTSQEADNTSAPYYVNGNGSIVKLNEDGFNMAAFGAISIQDNTKLTGTFMGFMATFPDRLCSGMFCGSTYGGVTYNTAGDETSGVKNLQFYGFMPMTNKTSESQYTCNGTKVSYRIAGPVRCVRNAE